APDFAAVVDPNRLTGLSYLALTGVQLFAAGFAAVFAFLVSLALVKGIDVVCGFVSDPKAEGEGLDRTEHGEVGFDLGLALEAAPEKPLPAPRPATAPPNGKRHFTVIVDGVNSK